jgi:hypothetical protein
VSVGLHGDGILIRSATRPQGINLVGHIIGRELEFPDLYQAETWIYFAVSRRSGAIRLHIARRNAGGVWIVKEQIWHTDARTINPANLPVLVGASAHNVTEAMTGYMSNFHLARVAPTNVTTVPFR